MPRTKILKNVTLVALGIIAVRLFFIQIIEHDAWVAKANEQHTILETIVAERGEIYMMDDGEPVPVVLNQTAYSVIIDPAVTDKDGLKANLEKNAKEYITADIDEIFDTEGLRYFVIAKGVPHSIATKIAEEGTSGVWFQKGNKRVYPEGELASGLLGFVNADGLGQYGVEGSLNTLLAGKDGSLKTISDINNVALSIGKDNVKIPAEDGKNVVLSVDRGLERGIEEIMAKSVADTAATNAAALIMDPNTGEVIAMANVPNYNPGDYGNVKDASAYTNYVTEVPYEPASICKSFVYSAAINEGRMSPSDTYFNEGFTVIDGATIKNAEQRATLNNHTLDMKTALYWSLNTGSIHALKLLGGDPNNITKEGREKMYDYYYNKFKLSQPTGIELMEGYGVIPDPNEGYARDLTYATMTFGQSMNVTMIQTAAAFSAVIDGGIWRTPTIVKGTLENGTINERTAVEIAEKQSESILTEGTSAIMREMLVNNRSYKVRQGIDRPGYAIGGKTGTAQVIIDGSYDDKFEQTIGSYIGFIGPQAELPKYVIMVKMWGKGQALAGTDAQDLFDKLSNYAIDYLQIKPRL